MSDFSKFLVFLLLSSYGLAAVGISLPGKFKGEIYWKAVSEAAAVSSSMISELMPDDASYYGEMTRGISCIYQIKKQAESTVQVFVFDMGEAIKAAKVFHDRVRNQSSHKGPGMQHCYLPEGFLFWKGNYIVELKAKGNKKMSREQFLNLAENIDGILVPQDNIPLLMTALPGGGRIQGTELVTETGFQGHLFLSNVVSADYLLGEEQVILFILEASSEKHALQIYDLCRDKFPKPEGGVPAMGIGAYSVLVRDGFMTVRNGSYLTGIFGGQASSSRVSLISSCLERQSHLSK